MPPEKEVLRSEDQLRQAMINSDINSLNLLIHPNLLFTIPNGQTITKEMDLEGYQSGKMVMEDIIPEKHSIEIIDDNAVVSVIAELKGRYLGESINGKYRYLRVWKRVEGQWKVIAGSSIMM